MIPLIDSLAHPTLTNQWIDDKNRDASFDKLIKDLQQANFIGACAVGLAGTENYSHENFIKACHPYKSLIPIAGFNPLTSANIANELDTIKALGYQGIKIHPRLSKLDVTHPILETAFNEASKRHLPIFYCSYQHTKIQSYPSTDPFYGLINLLKKVPHAKVVIVHGGNVELLRYAELARFNHNLLLDLSLTIMKYAHSSIDNDIRFLFESFDTRICIGSDHPEYTHADLRTRFEYFADGINDDKAQNIGYQNIIKFLGLEDRFNK